MDCTGNWIVKTQRAARYWKAEVRTPDIMDAEGRYAIERGQLIAVCYGKNTVGNANLIADAVNGCIATNSQNPRGIALSIKPMYELCQRVAKFRTTPDNALGMYEFLASIIEQAVGILNKSIDEVADIPERIDRRK